jgi:hypothetical protein
MQFSDQFVSTNMAAAAARARPSCVIAAVLTIIQQKKIVIHRWHRYGIFPVPVSGTFLPP